MVPDPRTPVIAGVGQVRGDPDGSADPLALFVAAAEVAGTDAGGGLLRRADVVASVMLGSSRAADPARLVAERLGLSPRATVRAGVGGNTPQLLVNELGDRIARGELDVALVGGAECLAARGPLRSAAAPRERAADAGGPEPERIGDERPGSSDEEMRHGMALPVQVYPLFETALRAAAGRGVAEHQRHIGALWAHFSQVAAANPFAWDREPHTAEQIATVGPDNRVVCFPYLKRMCARLNVDLGAALLVCAYETARAAGVPDDRLVFLHVGADGHEHWFPSHRWAVGETPGAGLIVREALAAAGVTVDDVARFDLYSCFPSAVQMVMAAIGLAGPATDPRPLTVTGGLAFAGGPLNNYVSHSIAAMVDACRADPGSIGMTTAIGWYATKHSVGIWSTEPPRVGRYRRVDPAGTQARIDALPCRDTTGPFDGEATIEATEVVVDRDGTPSLVVVLALAADGRRVVAASTDPDLGRAAMAEALEGRLARFRSDTDHTVFVG